MKFKNVFFCFNFRFVKHWPHWFGIYLFIGVIHFIWWIAQYSMGVMYWCEYSYVLSKVTCNSFSGFSFESSLRFSHCWRGHGINIFLENPLNPKIKIRNLLVLFFSIHRVCNFTKAGTACAHSLRSLYSHKVTTPRPCT